MEDGREDNETEFISESGCVLRGIGSALDDIETSSELTFDSVLPSFNVVDDRLSMIIDTDENLGVR